MIQGPRLNVIISSLSGIQATIYRFCSEKENRISLWFGLPKRTIFESLPKITTITMISKIYTVNLFYFFRLGSGRYFSGRINDKLFNSVICLWYQTVEKLKSLLAKQTTPVILIPIFWWSLHSSGWPLSQHHLCCRLYTEAEDIRNRSRLSVHS